MSETLRYYRTWLRWARSKVARGEPLDDGSLNYCPGATSGLHAWEADFGTGEMVCVLCRQRRAAS